MGDNFFVYMDRLVLMGFFSGYPLIYVIIRSLGENSQLKKFFKINISSLLPYAYALVGILYLGFFLKNLYPDYSVANIKSALQEPFLIVWGILSIFFFIPAANKKTLFSLLHSLVFFFFLVKDLYLNIFNSAGKEMLQNDMSIYTNSLILQTASFLFVIFVHVLYTHLRKQ